jgi:hypothetical protein
MSERIRSPRKLHVIAAIGVVLLLAASLGVRLTAKPHDAADSTLAGSEQQATGGLVPAPEPFRMADLSIPHWSHQNAKEWSLTFKTDLDLLAPLGTGGRNAGEWFVDFRKPDGPRYEEAKAMMERREDGGGDFGLVLPPDDPLLLEAEPWCDQATMSFYPELLEPNGWYTQIPNLLVPLNFARSWVARGVESPDPGAGLEDCRRAIRLGRLLRQEDSVIISDLVGLACVRMGAQGMFDIAVREGDAELALLASIVVGEVAPQRLLTSERITRTWDKHYLREDVNGNSVLEIPDEKLDAIIEMARSQPDRRFRAEAIIHLNLVRVMGSDAQKERVVSLLTELSGLDDPVLSETARYSLENEPQPSLIQELLK